jgi:hypothetical protein
MGFHTLQYRIGTLLTWTATGDIRLPDFRHEDTEAVA